MYNNDSTKTHRLGDICKIVGGGTPKTSEPSYWGGDLPWITSADIHGMDDVRPRKYVTPLGIENSAANISPKGSIVVVTRVGLGKVAIAPFDLSHSQDSQTLIFDHSVLHPKFLAWQIRKIAEHFIAIGRGTTISGITKKQLADQELWIPPIKKQIQIIEWIENSIQLISLIRIETKSISTQLEHMRYSILNKAFTSFETVSSEGDS